MSFTSESLINNKYATKLDTPELRQTAYKAYCAHIAKGKSKRSWYMSHPVSLTYETIEKYIRMNPMEFDPDEKKLAEAMGYGKWEGVVEASAEGKNKEANTASLQMLMRNKYGWDKAENRGDDSHSAAELNQEKLLAQINQRQIDNQLP